MTQTQSDATYRVYNHDAIMRVGQFLRESERDDLVDMAQEDCIVAAVQWFLDGHGRWSKAYIRRTAACFSQQIEQLGQCELIPASQARALLDALKNGRPRSKRQQRRSAKSMKLADLRRLIAFFRDHGERLNVWIAGYLQIASRIGWRPGEIMSMWLNGNYLRASAEKHTNERGLCDICEIGLHEYPRRLIKKLAAWIAETGELANERGGRWKLRDLVKKRILACLQEIGDPAHQPVHAPPCRDRIHEAKRFHARGNRRNRKSRLDPHGDGTVRQGANWRSPGQKTVSHRPCAA